MWKDVALVAASAVVGGMFANAVAGHVEKFLSKDGTKPVDASTRQWIGYGATAVTAGGTFYLAKTLLK